MNKRIWAWALYDWGNSAFATTVMAGFFPVFFKLYWADSLDAAASTFWLGLGNSIASGLMVLLAPIIGALADQGHRKKLFLGSFALLGVLTTSALFFVAQGHWQFALIYYALGVIGFSGSIIPYDALLVDVTEPKHYEWVSAFGYALGYLGGGLLFLFDMLLVLNHESFGLHDSGEAIRWAFVSVALWWGLFSLPVLFWVKESSEPKPVQAGLIKGAWLEMKHNFSHVRQHRMAFLFLIAYWLYIDGVDTIVRMAVDYGMALNFSPQDLMKALLITQFVGFPAAIAFGYIGQYYGPKRGISIALFIYILIVLWAWQMRSAWEFYALAVAIGLVQGGIQSLSRALYARLIPEEEAGLFFGIYNMLGKFAAVIGPVMMGATALLLGDVRHSILVLLLLFVSGWLILLRVRENQT